MEILEKQEICLVDNPEIVKTKIRQNLRSFFVQQTDDTSIYVCRQIKSLKDVWNYLCLSPLKSKCMVSLMEKLCINTFETENKLKDLLTCVEKEDPFDFIEDFMAAGCKETTTFFFDAESTVTGVHTSFSSKFSGLIPKYLLASAQTEEESFRENIVLVNSLLHIPLSESLRQTWNHLKLDRKSLGADLKFSSLRLFDL